MDYEAEILELKEQVSSLQEIIALLSEDIQYIKSELIAKPNQVDVGSQYDSMDQKLKNFSNVLKTMNSQIAGIKADIKTIQAQL